MDTLFDAAGKTSWITVHEEYSTRSLLLDGCEEGAMSLDSEEPVFAYLWFHKSSHLVGRSIRKALVLGAGAFTAAKCIALDHPQADIDTVDVEPDLEKIARQYFHLDRPEFSRIHFHGMPAEHFLTTILPGSYDFILDDLFNGFQHVPEEARSADHLRLLRSAMAPGGVCVKNMIWDPLSVNSRATCSDLQESWALTLPNHLVLAMGNPDKGHNFLLLGLKAVDPLRWDAIKAKLMSVEVPASILYGINARFAHSNHTSKSEVSSRPSE